MDNKRLPQFLLALSLAVILVAVPMAFHVWNDEPDVQTTTRITYVRRIVYTTEKATTVLYTVPPAKHTTTRRYKVKTKKQDDPYNAKDYAHADDFYEDHYDDFFDYEDAEDYYNKYGN
ncbi:MAG TPA: hypothetical protein DDY98_08290 [Ruminococcaceae bacterium]|nr:hypothetical protein [Oscillospiraceae bacterium]